jgi:hypothetical protein
VTDHREAHPSVEGRAQERICILDRGGFGRKDHESVVRNEEVVENRRMNTGSEIDQDEIRAQARWALDTLSAPG